jgi:hypothetical protein
MKGGTMFYNDLQLMKSEAQRREGPEIERLIAQRDQFLRDHPHLMALQKEIDSLLGTTLDPVKRLEILFMIMTDRLIELRSVFTEVVRLARTAMIDEGQTP